ncbi:MAG: hypothetical protein Q8Q41_02565 [bacterium]|nr:hypothetical protein [bacterium]
MDDIKGSFARVVAHISCTLESQIATSTIAADIETVERIAGSDPYWRPRLACARSMLAERKRTKARQVDTLREAAKKRYSAHLKDRSETQRQLAKLGGAAKKQKK